MNLAALSLELAIGFAIGLALGMLGGGGSILTVPALVYLVGQTPRAAVTISLAIVGANSIVGASMHGRQGTMNWRVALMFGGGGMLAAYLASGFGKEISPTVLLIAFSILMLVVGALMLRNTSFHATTQQPHWTIVIAAGIGIGVLTGFLGVGGGFLIVPALVMFVGLPMPEAVGTSLLVIALNSFAGLFGHLRGEALPMTLLLVLVAAGIAGTMVGARLAKRLPAAQLRRMFGVFVIVLGAFMVTDNVIKMFGGVG